MGALYYLVCSVVVICCTNVKITVLSQRNVTEETSSLNATRDAKALHEAIDGFGTNEDTVIGIVASRTPAELMAIKATYMDLYKKDLREKVGDDLSGSFRDTILALLEPPYDFLAKELGKALEEDKVDDKCLSEILCTAEGVDLKSIIIAYNTTFNKTLMATIEEKLTGDHKTFFQALITPPLRHFQPVNESAIAKQVESIKNLGTTKCDASNSILMELMAKSSYEQIRHVLHKFETDAMGVEKSLKEHCKEPLLDTFISTVIYAKNPGIFYSRILHKAMVGVGTDENTVIRVLVSKKSVPLSDIQQMYYKTYKTTLGTSIKAETSGFFKEALMTILANNI